MREGFRIRVRPWTPRASPRDYQSEHEHASGTAWHPPGPTRPHTAPPGAAAFLPGPPGEAGVPCGAGTPGRLHCGWCDSSGRGSGWGRLAGRDQTTEGHIRPGPVSRAKRDDRTPDARRRRRRESNPCTGLCRPLPKPLGHSATEALPAAERPAQKAHHGSREPWVSPDGVRRLRADDGIRTRDPHLGKVMLYQLSHVRVPADKTDGRRNSARRANRTVADPGRVANSGSIFALHAAPSCVRVAT